MARGLFKSLTIVGIVAVWAILLTTTGRPATDFHWIAGLAFLTLFFF